MLFHYLTKNTIYFVAALYAHFCYQIRMPMPLFPKIDMEATNGALNQVIVKCTLMGDERESSWWRIVSGVALEFEFESDLVKCADITPLWRNAFSESSFCKDTSCIRLSF